MFKVFILLGLVAYGLGASLQQQEARIVEGTVVTIDQYPYIVSVQLKGEHICSGVIYSQNAIITTAMCLFNTNKNDMSVRFGSSYADKGGYVYKVKNVLVHENFSIINMSYDIALISLSEELSFSKDVESVPLATAMPQEGAQGIILGYGAAFEGPGFHDQRLQLANMVTLNTNTCSAPPYSYPRSVLAYTMFCGAGYGKDICQGDAGAPFVYKNNLIGIASWGMACGSPNFPPVFTDITYLKNWIVSNAVNI